MCLLPARYFYYLHRNWNPDLVGAVRELLRGIVLGNADGNTGIDGDIVLLEHRDEL